MDQETDITGNEGMDATNTKKEISIQADLDDDQGNMDSSRSQSFQRSPRSHIVHVAPSSQDKQNSSSNQQNQNNEAIKDDGKGNQNNNEKGKQRNKDIERSTKYRVVSAKGERPVGKVAPVNGMSKVDTT